MNFADDIFDDEEDPAAAPARGVSPQELSEVERQKAQAQGDFARLKEAVETRQLAEADMIELLSANVTFRKLFLDPLDAQLTKMVNLAMNCDAQARPEEVKAYVLAFQKLRKFREGLRLHREHGEKVLERAIQALMTR